MLPVQANLHYLLSEIKESAPGYLPPEQLSEWDQRAQKISGYWRWFTGEALEELDLTVKDKDGQHPLKYPLKINPISLAARLHAYALLGESDQGAPLIQTICQPRKTGGEAIAEEADDAIAQVEYENHFRTMQIDNALSTQTLGGIVWKVGWDNQDPLRETGIRYEYFDPRDFHCTYWGTDYLQLTQAWVRRLITKADAWDQYHVKINSFYGTYLEYWNADEYWVRIDDKLALDRRGNEIQGQHGFGFVPFVYAAHERANSFWGISLAQDATGMAAELNDRKADMGDAVKLSVLYPPWMRNVRGQAVIKTIDDQLPVIDLGRNMGTDPEPEMGQVDGPTLPQGATDFVRDLQEDARISLLTPEIAYGKEEGSQRSGQTLYTRMWPMLAHVGRERDLWADALGLLSEYALRIMALKARRGITKAHLNLRKRHKFAPMVPQDRAQLVEELIRRRQEDAISPELMVEKFGDAGNLQQEIERIQAIDDAAQKLEEAKTQKALEPKPAFQAPKESQP